MSWYGLVLIAAFSMFALMVGLWIWQRRTGMSSVVDVVWAFSVGALGIAFCLASDGLLARRLLLITMVSAWSLRLGLYILQRVVTMPEDGRYREMHDKWGDQLQSKMFWFYQLQAFGAVLFALPMLIAANNPAPLSVLDFVGVGLFVFSLLGEILADWQLHRFRITNQRTKKVCQRGLWKFSRHPNYFFEWLHWWSYLLLAISGFSFGWGWLNLVFPMAMFYFIRFKTGIPPTEKQALKSRGEAYRHYQETTNAFFPWFPKRKIMKEPAGQSASLKGNS